MYSSSLDEIQNEATDEEDLFEQDERSPNLSLAASDSSEIKGKTLRVALQ